MHQMGQKAVDNTEVDNIRVLIVEDHKSAATLLKSILRQAGVTNIDIAHGHTQAITRCQLNAYDLLFIDYHLDDILTGTELVSLLRRRRHITTYCGVILLSGDHSAEVILTSLSVEPDSFITKPITTDQVQKKLFAVMDEITLRKPIYQAMETGNHEEAVSLCKQSLQHSGYHRKREGLLLDLLMTNNQWGQAERFATLLQKYHPSAHISLVQAKIAAHKDNLPAAIALLQRQLTETPLHIELYDYLAEYQEQNRLRYEALETAQKALTLTPGISHRALRVARLAAELDKTEQLIKAGHTLAGHLPIIDVEWIICFSQYMAIYEQAYFQHAAASLRAKLRQALKQIDRRAQSRILPAQQPFLTSFSHIMTARITLGNVTPLKAKRRLLLGMSTYFDMVTKLPSVMIADAMPLLIHFGETQLIAECQRALSLRDRFDHHSQQRLRALRENTLLVQAVRQLERRLAEAYDLLESPEQALPRYEAILVDYPLSTEANLGRLQCLYALNMGEEQTLRQSLQAISSMPLPDSLDKWRTRLFELMASPCSSPGQVRLIRPYQKRTRQFLLAGYGQAPQPGEEALGI